MNRFKIALLSLGLVTSGNIFGAAERVITIEVKGQSRGEHEFFTLTEDATIGQLKNEILLSPMGKRNKLTPKLQKLIFAGYDLDNDAATLRDHNIKGLIPIYLAKRLMTTGEVTPEEFAEATAIAQAEKASRNYSDVEKATRAMESTEAIYAPGAAVIYKEGKSTFYGIIIGRTEGMPGLYQVNDGRSGEDGITVNYTDIIKQLQPGDQIDLPAPTQR